MKTRVYKQQLRGALVWYQEQIGIKFDGQLLRPSVIEAAENYLRELRVYKQTQEKNNVWDVNVKLVTDPETNTMWADITDRNEVLFLDFDG